MKSTIALLLSSFLFSLNAQDLTVGTPESVGISAARLARIDHRIEKAIKDQWFPGAVVLIARNNRIIYHKAFGLSDIEKKTLMRRDDIFRIASQSKAITSLAAMMLYEEGKFRLEDPVSKFIPEFKNPQVLENFDALDSSYTSKPAEEEITIRHLLTHTSGIDYAGIGSQEFRAIYAKAGIPSGIGNADMLLSEKMKILGKMPLKHEPGDGFTYSLSIDVLGHLVELWSGQSLADYFQSKIFTPLGMKDTWFYLPKEKHGRLISIYEESNSKLLKVDHLIYDNVNPQYPTLAGTYYSGGAGLSSTIEDYARFLQMINNGGELDGKRLISRKTVQMMLTNQTGELSTQFGLGFALETQKNDHLSPASLGSYSWGGAFNTTYWGDPEENLVALLYTQIYNSKHREIGALFKALTYQSIAD